MQNFGLAYNFKQKELKVYYLEFWACPQLVARKIQLELSRCLGLATGSG